MTDLRRAMMAHLHNQYPTKALTEQDYETLLVHLSEQLTARCQAEGYPEDQAACDALTNTFGTSEDQTVLDWLRAAGRRLTVSTDDCVGV